MQRVNVRQELVLFIIILVIALALRLWKIDGYMNFLGDEGRDAIIVSELIIDKNIPFIGPPTSVGNIYLGPLYYYMMAVPMALSGLNPVSAAVMVALIGTAAVGLVYYLAREWFGVIGALIGGFLYAISPVTITYSKSSWNPNPAPFFTLLAFFGFYRARQSGNFWWLGLVGLGLAGALQMHYLTLALIPIFGVLWLVEVSLSAGRKIKQRNFWKGTVLALVVFLIMMSPLVMFDLKHDFLNFKAFIQIFHNEGGLKPFGFVFNLWSLYQQKLVGHYLAGGNEVIAWMVALLILVPLGGALYTKYKMKVLGWGCFALGLWLIGGLAIVSGYNGEIYDHYIGFLGPAIYLLLAGFITMLLKYRFGVYVTIFGLGGLVYVNLVQNPLRFAPNNQLQRTQDIATFIRNDVKGQPFNFALIAKQNYDDAYQFFLTKIGAPLRQIQSENTGVLYVVCEDVVCEPIGNAKYEIAAFGWAQQEWLKEIAGIKVYKLVPYVKQPKSIN